MKALISGPGPKRPLTKEEFIDQRVMEWVIQHRLDGEAVDEKMMRKIIREMVEKHGTETHDSYGYPLYGKRPWELPDPVFSWKPSQSQYLVRPAVLNDPFFKSMPLAECRFVDIVMIGVADEALIRSEATKVYRHFVAEINARHPQADQKYVLVRVYSDSLRGQFVEAGSELDVPIALVEGSSREAGAGELPQDPSFKWTPESSKYKW